MPHPGVMPRALRREEVKDLEEDEVGGAGGGELEEDIVIGVINCSLVGGLLLVGAF